MSDLTSAIQDALAQDALVEQAQESADGVRNQATARMQVIRERIKKGDSTGDRIRDFVIVRYGRPDEAIEAKYREFETLIGQHIGQFVLLVTRGEGLWIRRNPGPAQEGDWGIETEYELGVIESGELLLDLEHETYEIPTGRRRVTWKAGTEPHHAERNVGAFLYRDTILGNGRAHKLEHVQRHSQDPILAVEIVVGDDAVRAWWENQQSLLRFWELAELLDRPDPNSPAQIELRRLTVTARLVELLVGHRHPPEVDQEVRELLRQAVELSMRWDHPVVLLGQLSNAYGVG